MQNPKMHASYAERVHTTIQLHTQSRIEHKHPLLMRYCTSAAFPCAGTARGQYADWQVWDAQQVFNQLEEGTLYSQCPRVVSSGVFSHQGKLNSCMVHLCGCGPPLCRWAQNWTSTGGCLCPVVCIRDCWLVQPSISGVQQDRGVGKHCAQNSQNDACFSPCH